jgi:hypothetical protein
MLARTLRTFVAQAEGCEWRPLHWASRVCHAPVLLAKVAVLVMNLVGTTHAANLPLTGPFLVYIDISLFSVSDRQLRRGIGKVFLRL